MIQRHVIAGATLGAIMWALTGLFNANFHLPNMLLGLVIGAGIGLIVGVTVQMIGPQRRSLRILCWIGIGIAMGLNGGVITTIIGISAGITGGVWAVGVEGTTVRKVIVIAVITTVITILLCYELSYRIQPWVEQQQQIYRATAVR